MPENAFEQEYAAMTDDQLLQVQADRKDLVPDALAALDREVQRRDLTPSSVPRWVPGPDSDDGTRCLEDVLGYRSLDRTRRFLGRFGYWIALGGVVLDLLSAKYAYKNPDTYKTIVGWLALVFGYWTFVRLRIAAYSCPQCAQRFGSGAACYFCGFPRACTREYSANTNPPSPRQHA